MINLMHVIQGVLARELVRKNLGMTLLLRRHGALVSARSHLGLSPGWEYW